MPQILSTDAVLVIGGGKSTETAGYVAPALGRPVLIIGAFGGAASKLWKDFNPYYEKLGQLSEKIPKLNETWESSNADLAVQILQELVQRKIFKMEPKKPHLFALIAEIVLLTIWVWIFAGGFTRFPMIARFFILMPISAFLGAGLRNTLRLTFDPTAEISWTRLLNELGAGMLLGFGLILIYLVGGIFVIGDDNLLDQLANPANFSRLAVTMSLLGFAGGLMIERVAESLRMWIAETVLGKISKP